MNLTEHRQAIDELDAQIIQLLNERTKHVLEIGAYKLKHGEEIYAPHRELAVLQRICKLNPGPITGDSLKAIYREIMSSALSLEKTMAIAYLGPEATFTHQAALQRFGSSLHYAPQRTIADVFSEVTKGRADYGVVPIENSTEGVVTHTLDMFVDSDLKIVSQIVLPISHCLVSRIPREQIKKLYVHPQTLAQCRVWIQKHLPQAGLIETSSNARSAEFAAKQRNAAAIAGVLAAEKYRVPVIERDIQDNSSNATRYVVLGRKCPPATGRDLTTLLLALPNTPGELDKVLQIFSRLKINLNFVQSSSTQTESASALIFVEFSGHISDKPVSKLLRSLAKASIHPKELGSYPEFD